MKKFNETVHENQNWKDIAISDKWALVVIESPDIIDYDDTVKMICQCDDIFCGYRIGCGNDRHWNNMIWDTAGVPEDIPSWCDHTDSISSKHEEAIEKYRKRWNVNPSSFSDCNVFKVSLFSSYYTCGPLSFVNYKTGKVGLVHTIGKWCKNIGSVDEELEWFAKNYPQYKFFITFCNDENGNTTLMIYNGKIVRVVARTYKEFKYVYKINHLNGSTCAKAESIFKKFFWRFIGLWYRKILPKISTNMYNEWVIDRNFGLNYDEKYFDYKHAQSVIFEYKNSLE